MGRLLFIFIVLIALIAVVILVVTLAVVAALKSRSTPRRKGAMIISCPSRPRWRDWLDSRLDAADRTDFAVHLEGCLHCQRMLDDMSGADQGWANLASEAFTAAPPEPGFVRAVNELKDRPPAVTRDSSLSFLQPSDDPEHLGKMNGYEVLSEVGRGGMGVVLKAFDPKLRRVVAIKVLAPHLAASGPARVRFLREARAAAAVVHEHVVTIHAVEEGANPPYLVMQFVDGRSLQDRLDREGPLAVKEVLRIGMQAARGLAAAHAQGLVHRDIKPANILLENGVERVKLADFGLARATDDASLTHSGVITGSPLYMSPEQARGDTADSRSDLFGLGCVLYAMCAGHSPFRAPTALAVLKRVCDDAPRPLHEINPEIPDWLEAIIFRLLAKDPEDRFGSSAEVAAILGQHLRHLQEPDSPAPPPVVVPESAYVDRRRIANSVPRPSQSNRVLWLVLALLLLPFLLCAGVPVLLLFLRAAPNSSNNGLIHDGPAIIATEATAAVERNVFTVLTDKNAPDLAALSRLCTIDSAAYSPRKLTVTWSGTTKKAYASTREAAMDLQDGCGPFEFFNQQGRSLGQFKLKLVLGKRTGDGRYQVLFDLKLNDEIVSEATSFQINER